MLNPPVSRILLPLMAMFAAASCSGDKAVSPAWSIRNRQCGQHHGFLVSCSSPQKATAGNTGCGSSSAAHGAGRSPSASYNRHRASFAADQGRRRAGHASRGG